MPDLPARPSREYLRKEAKRLARDRGIELATAQRLLAIDYGFDSWPRLAAELASRESARDRPLFAAIRAGDAREVRRLLASGVNPRVHDGEPALHLAARLGPAAVVEALLEGGALEWQADVKGHKALAVARKSRASDRDAIVALLDRDAISDASFRAAVEAVQTGDVVALERLLDAEPHLLHERMLGPEVYRKAERAQYFRDPKLFWFVANNPGLIEVMPANIVDVASAMIARGVEPADLDYTLALVMSCAIAQRQAHQIPLMEVLLRAGARAERSNAVAVAAGHWELDAVRALVAFGHPVDTAIAASLGDEVALARLLASASPAEVQTAFGLAVINRHVRAATLALDAGADIDHWLPIHAHSTALHQAAVLDDVAMIEMLLARGARPDVRDLLWNGTPLGWAIHENRPGARAILERTASP